MVSINPMQTKRFETEEAECRNQYYKISLKKDKICLDFSTIRNFPCDKNIALF